MLPDYTDLLEALEDAIHEALDTRDAGIAAMLIAERRNVERKMEGVL